jgi:hypothetical protein
MSEQFIILHSEHGLRWAGPENGEDIANNADREIRGLMHSITALHEKLNGLVGSRVIMFKGFKLVVDHEGQKTIIGDNTNVFPSPYTHLFSRSGFAPEAYYNPQVMEWIRRGMAEELSNLQAKYAAYNLALCKFVTENSSNFTVSTE